MNTNHPSKYYPKAGGQFEPVSTGQFEPVKGGQFKPARGGQLQPDFAVDSLMLVNTGWGYGNFEVQPIKQNEQIELIIYPNPTSNNELTLTHTCNANGFFVLFNMLGQELMRVHIDSKINKIALPNLINGIYTYKCEFYGCSSVNGSIKIIK